MSFLSRWLGLEPGQSEGLPARNPAPPSAAPAPSAASTPLDEPQKPPVQAAEASPQAQVASSAPDEAHALLVELELEVHRFLGSRTGKIPFLISELRKRL
jgi:hypothetical protein